MPTATLPDESGFAGSARRTRMREVIGDAPTMTAMTGAFESHRVIDTREYDVTGSSRSEGGHSDAF